MQLDITVERRAICKDFLGIMGVLLPVRVQMLLEQFLKAFAEFHRDKLNRLNIHISRKSLGNGELLDTRVRRLTTVFSIPYLPR